MEKENNQVENTDTIIDTKETKIAQENNPNKAEKKKKSKTRMILVIIFLLLFAAVSYVQLRGSYLEYLELGESYTNIFYTNLVYRYGIMLVNFVVLYFMIYFTNRIQFA